MEQKIRYKIRPVRLIFYLIFWAAAFFFYNVFRSYFLWLAVLVMTFLPVISVAGAVYLCGRIVPELLIDRPRAAKTEEILLELHLRNDAWWLALHCQMQLSFSNTFLERVSTLSVQMPAAIHRDSVLTLPFRAVELGRYTVSCGLLTVQDVMGFLYCQKEISLSKELSVIPRQNAVEPIDVTGFMAGAAEREESRQKGNDFAQVSDVREYISGDRFRDIHWKLSARQETLMVKERMSMAGSEMVLMLKLVKDSAQTEQILEFAWYLGKSFMTQRLPVCLLCWNQPAFQWEEYDCGTMQELAEAYGGIFSLALSDRVNENAGEHMRNCYPFLKSYLAVAVQDGAVRVQMCENN